ncbi:MAG: chorismate synthase [Candidatus Aminicenantes bacterium]|nr:chorismate synthase [Candidatus Aminicenantes bacterium]
MEKRVIDGIIFRLDDLIVAVLLDGIPGGVQVQDMKVTGELDRRRKHRWQSRSSFRRPDIDGVACRTPGIPDGRQRVQGHVLALVIPGQHQFPGRESQRWHELMADPRIGLIDDLGGCPHQAALPECGDHDPRLPGRPSESLGPGHINGPEVADGHRRIAVGPERRRAWVRALVEGNEGRVDVRKPAECFAAVGRFDDDDPVRNVSLGEAPESDIDRVPPEVDRVDGDHRPLNDLSGRAQLDRRNAPGHSAVR